MRVLSNSLLLRSWHYGRLITVLGISPSGLSVAGDSLEIHELTLSIPRDRTDLLRWIGHALLLKRMRGVTFCDSPDGIIADTPGFKLLISTSQEFFVLREILCDEIYNFGLAPRDVVVWDVGMNVGAASLYFATRPYVRAVVGFEPFRPTFEVAKKNIAMNPGLHSKIKPYNLGIAARASSMEVEYDSSLSGIASLVGVPEGTGGASRLSGRSATVTLEHVDLIAADCALREILRDYPNCAIVAKIDCEGSEYEIIRCLHEKRLLRELSVIILEWHKLGPRELQNILHEAGFSTYSLYSTDTNTGMLYAAKTA